MISNATPIPVQCLPDIDTDAGKVNVQLVLRTAHSRIDCQTNSIPRKRPVHRLVDVGSSFPGDGKIVRRVWPTNDWTLDAGDSRCRNQQELIAPSWVPEDRESIFDSRGQIDFQAGLGIVMLGLPGDAHVVNYFPQGVSREFSLSRIGREQKKYSTSANRHHDR